MADDLTLYVTSWSIYPRRVLTYLRAKGIQDKVKIVETDFSILLQAEGKPPGQVPILTIGGGRFITESTAIIEYLEAIFPDEPRFLGDDPYQTAKIKSIISATDTAFPFFLLYFMNSSKIMEISLKDNAPRNAEAARMGLAFAHKFLNVLVRNLSKTGPLLTDSQRLTAADIVLAASLAYLTLGYGLTPGNLHPRLQEFWDAVKDEGFLDLVNWVKVIPEAFREYGKVLNVTWDNLDEIERGIARDIYIEK